MPLMAFFIFPQKSPNKSPTSVRGLLRGIFFQKIPIQAGQNPDKCYMYVRGVNFFSHEGVYFFGKYIEGHNPLYL